MTDDMVVRKILWSESNDFEAVVKHPKGMDDTEILEHIWDTHSLVDIQKYTTGVSVFGHEVISGELTTEEPDITIEADNASK